MRKISDTIARLARLRAQQDPSIPGFETSGRLLDLGAFGSNPGMLKARFHVAKNLPDGAPLVVVLHGCTQNAAGYDHGSGWSQLADEAGFAVLYPEQQRANNPNLCFNWFHPAHARRGSGEALSIRQMIETMVLDRGLDRQRIFVTGLSAGGAMAAVMLATYPEVFAGGGIIAGLPYGVASTVPEAFDRMRGHGGPTGQGLQQILRSASTHDGPWPRISIWQGSADHTVAASNAEAIAAQWRAAHGLGNAPTHSSSDRGRTRQVWRNPTGQALIEVNMLAGMGHGTPIGGDGLGAAGPFMLDVGISSTREIGRFWNITGFDREGASMKPVSAEGQGRPSAGKENARTMEPVAGRHTASTPSKVQKIIEDALRSAGLMR